MKYTVIIEKKVQKKLKKLPTKIQKSIVFKIKSLQNFSDLTPNIKRLSIPLNGYRLRIGDYRILFTKEEKEILIYLLGHRKDVYK